MSQDSFSRRKWILGQPRAFQGLLRAALGSLFCLFLAVGVAWCGESIPREAYQWHRTLIREVRLYWGMSHTSDMFAAQIHQESRWRATAHSAYASGLGQQTPDTVKWLGQLYPADLGRGDAFDPHWSIRALVMYDRKLWQDFQAAKGDDARWSFVLSAYNGGAGWVRREQRLAQTNGRDPNLWFCNVEHARVRGIKAFDENRDYPRKIFRWRLLYRGW